MSNIKELLSNIRSVSLDSDIDAEGKNALIKYSRYLLSDEEDKEYDDLYEFLTWFGKKYIFPEVNSWVQDLRYHGNLNRIYDMGCGTGWLGTSLKNANQAGKSLKVTGVDRRKPSSYNGSKLGLDDWWNWDLEVDGEFKAFLRDQRIQTISSSSKNLFIGSHFLHCVDNWKEIIKSCQSPWIIIEPTCLTGEEPYSQQLKHFGAEPLSEIVIEQAFLNSGFLMSKKEQIEDQTLWMFLPLVEEPVKVCERKPEPVKASRKKGPQALVDLMNLREEKE